MLQQLKNLSRLRKYYLLYEFLTKTTYVFLIALTVGLLGLNFGEVGKILKEWLVPLMGLAVFLPGISRYIVKNPVRSYTWVVAVEVVCVFGFWLTEWGIYPGFLLIGSWCVMMCTASVLKPLKDKNISQVIKGDGEFSILRTRVNALGAVVIATIGFALLYYRVSTLYAVTLTTTCLIISRYVYVHVMEELYIIEDGRSKGYK